MQGPTAEGGETACYAEQLCPECGAVLDGTGHRSGCTVASTPRGEVVLRFEVPPRHCDAQAMMHASRPYEYFEDAFLAWLERECGGYRSIRAEGYDFVIVESGCRYAQPARLGDLIDVSVRPTAAGRSAFSVEIDLARGTEAIATGSITYVSVRDGASAPIPDSLRGPLAGVPRLERKRV